jgi:pyruvate dehydrogenase E2 component (dihydrolipoamide acetyltransferase)
MKKEGDSIKPGDILA